MAPVTEDQVEAVRALVAAIPPGRVRTYGDLSSEVGLASPRIVGWIMRTDSADLPWHRVVPASGRPAAGLRARQLERLRAEGVPIVDDRIVMKSARL
ncbi:MGMT family protein [Gordonia sp. PDNC005]|uniref:MGMT family protein n=1 Tax=unclassified Gordonia (in: high G+C Gram-positive bacteria) TaxID=2657482 RepID=UPI0019637CF5|nr:MGMT family protein [Gordonia sp. PDNC005]QRY61401.1 MGMT family protein [Gordonia sp. PDNC005]